jgi:hypothetical protein
LTLREHKHGMVGATNAKDVVNLLDDGKLIDSTWAQLPPPTSESERGTRLGTPDPSGAVVRMGEALRAQTARFAANVLPIIREVQAAGHTSANAIAGQLNARKVATARGGRWTHVQVRQIINRSAAGR